MCAGRLLDYHACVYLRNTRGERRGERERGEKGEGVNYVRSQRAAYGIY